jgi:demethoxyubiquinone hydroxylase (CLK1/Coq7/Cat5 family)
VAALLEIFWQGEAFALGQVAPAAGEEAAEGLGEVARSDNTAATASALILNLLP